MTRYVLSILASAALLPLAAQNDVDTEDRDASAAAMQAALPPDTIPNGWQRSGIFNINMTQVNLTNWAAGGFSSVSGIAMFNGTADWKKDRKAWDNSLILAFGGQHIHNGSGPQKTDDRIELNSKYGYELKKSLYLAGVFQFRSQFTEGFNADGDRISNFLAPGYALLGVGLDYRPSENFTVFFSPLTARMIIMNDKTLFGGSTDPDLRVYGVKNGSTTELEVGGYVRMQYKRELAKNITFLTRGSVQQLPTQPTEHRRDLGDLVDLQGERVVRSNVEHGVDLRPRYQPAEGEPRRAALHWARHAVQTDLGYRPQLQTLTEPPER
ncbi:MAG: DUF3078 domain-containing protein [Flavobacteriales bacterium]|nr:DUF3078 domain-containing protein [Flavobacteriales bacterium]